MKALRCIILLVFFSFHLTLYAEPQNLSLLTQDLITYHDSGLYQKELSSTVVEAKQYIAKEIETNNQRSHKKKLAIVLDIDETSISNYDSIFRHHFYLDAKTIHQEILTSNAQAIKPTLDLYRFALKNGVHVFFVSGRYLSEENATKNTLRKVGYTHWSGLYLRQNTDHSSSNVAFKTEQRRFITRQKYSIIASIGDQYSDLMGGYAKRVFKLPNPFYYLP